MTDLEQAHASGIAPWDLKIDDLCNFHVTVFQDRFPVAVGHLLFVPNYNTPTVIVDAFESALAQGNFINYFQIIKNINTIKSNDT
jgi:hypothetical protein